MSIASTLPNTAKITDQMAGMPDAALQQMAMMYKQDPYVLPLIVSESRRRQMLRTQAQGQNSMQMGPPPKVADQAIAAMTPPTQPAPPMPGRPMPSMEQMQQQLPENRGIATLPSAQNTEYAAEGGIMGYANEGFVDTEEVPGPPAQFIRSGIMGRRINPAYLAWEQTYGEKWRAQRKEAMKTAPLTVEQKQAMAPGLMSNLINQTALAGEVSANAPAVSDAYPDEISSGRTAYQDTGAAARSFNDIIDPAQKPPAAQTPAGIAQLVQPPAVAPAPDVGKIVREAYAPIEGPAAEIEGRLFVLGQEAEAEAYRRNEELKEQQKSGAELFKKRGERLDAREKEIAKNEYENKWFSVLLAGLEMAATPGTLGQAASAGAKAGSANYIKGQEKLSAARDKLLDARDRHEEFMLNRDDMNLKERRASEKEIADTKRRSQELAIEGIKLRLNVSTEKAKAIIKGSTDLALQQQQLQTQANISTSAQASQRAIAAGPGDLQKLYTALGGGDLQKGFETAKKLEAGSRKDLMSEYTDWLKANPTLAMDSDQAVSEFLRQYMLVSNTTRTVTPPKGAPVLKQP